MASRLAISLCFVVLAFVGASSLHLRRRRNTETCDEKDLDKCIGVLALMMPSSPEINVELIDSPEKLDEMCTQVHLTLDCVANETSDCEMEQMLKISIDTIRGAAGYVCSEEGKRILLKEAKCLESPTLEHAARSCMEEIVEQASGTSDYCGVIEEIIDCARTATEELCGEEAAMFVERLSYELVKPISNSMLGCDLQIRVARDLLRSLSIKRK